MRTRAIAFALTLWAVLTLNFFLPRLLPGDPLNALFDRDTASYVADDALRARLAAYYGLDRPLGAQYVEYLLETARGNLGWSIWLNRPVSQLILEHLPWTLLLTLSALALASLIGIGLGAEAGWRRGTRLDRVLVTLSIIATNAPVYVVGMMLLILFAARLDWFPLSGGRTPFARYDSPLAAAQDIAWHWILPATTLVLHLVGAKFLIVRNTMVSVLGEDFMLMARAKGLREIRLKRAHALRNALLPFVAQLGAQMGMAITGTIFIETTFDYPGMGRLIFDAVAARDYPVIQGVFVVVALVVLTANLVADWINARLDPRVEVK